MSTGTGHPPLDHRLRRMTGRDPDEPHRAATPLELLFDLMFVVAFGQAGTQTAHLLELGHWTPAIIAFLISVFAIWWAWINYSWLASAYDNDDIFFRVATLVAMVGVLVVALGIPALFHSIDEGEHVDNGIVVAGYVVIRIATVALWLRAARHDPARRRTAMTYVRFVGVAQLGWIVLIVVSLPLVPTLVCTVALGVLELVGPYVAEHGREGGTPWHAHHIAERYGLLVIITLGEIVLGTIFAISAVIEEQGWTAETIAVAFGGTTLAFGLWWVYFTVPSGKVLQRFRRRGFVWGYLHYFIFVALAGTGAGLHVAAYVIEGAAHIGIVEALLTVTVPAALFLVALFAIYALLLRTFDPLQVWLFIGSVLLLVAAVVAVAAGASFGVGILITAAAPFVVVVGYETVGHRHEAAALQRALGD
ncbi:low temperature requirement protein A [Agromyces sp. LHK192]|uniref:low temperature requirement protein A n=1 Tax=Agromyces sp. LHK192 TaxID=2498704 RepID=UPI000FD73BCB|nr:low temperature requirement protein A [Agromyces sp. LHK192]